MAFSSTAFSVLDSVVSKTVREKTPALIGSEEPMKAGVFL